VCLLCNEVGIVKRILHFIVVACLFAIRDVGVMKNTMTDIGDILNLFNRGEVFDYGTIYSERYVAKVLRLFRLPKEATGDAPPPSLAYSRRKLTDECVSACVNWVFCAAMLTST